MKTLATLVRNLLNHETNSVTLVEETLNEIARSDHIFISVFERDAHAAAQEALKRRREGRTRGPLDGIPLAVKDVIDVAGFRTTAGSPTTYDRPVAGSDAAVVAHLRDQGMIVIGKTNLSEFAFSGIGMNPSFGTPLPLLDKGPARVPGGSSSGSAIALQRGIVPAALGTDTAGSIRVPAAFNGLVGFRGSRSRYKMDGVQPLAPTYDSLGPMALTIEDCVILDGGMRGKAVWPGGPLQTIRELRFVVATDILNDPTVDAEIAGNVIRFERSLRLAGARVDSKPVEALSHARRLIAELGWPGGAEAYALLRGTLGGIRGRLVDPLVRSRLNGASHIRESTLHHFAIQRKTLMERIRLELDGAILLTPTVGHVAPLLAPLERSTALFASTNLSTLSLTMPGSLLDMPGIAMPSGYGKDHLPTSVLLSVPSGEDRRLLHAALSVEHALEHDYLERVR